MIAKINGVTITNFEENIEENKKRIKELNTATLTIFKSTLDEAYDMDLQVEVTTNDLTVLYYVIADDKFHKTSNSPKLYEHSLTLVEPTKLLEGITMSKYTFRNKTNPTVSDGVSYSIWDQLVRIRNIANIEKTSVLATTRKWDYSTAIIPHLGMNLQAYTETRLGAELTTNRPNARQAIDEVLSQIDAEVLMNDFTIVEANFYNETKSSIDLTDLVNYQGQQTAELQADRFDLFLENTISEKDINKQAIIYPSKHAWGSVRANGDYLTSDSFLMEVQEDIDKVLKFEIFAETTSDLPPSGSVSETIKVDITELLLEKTAWQSLLYDIGDPRTTPVRNNSVYYVQGDNKIQGFHEKLDVFSGILVGDIFSYQHLLSYAATKFAGAARGVTRLDDFENFMFRLTYVPIMSERLRLEKPYAVSEKTLFFNQTEQIPDIEKQGKNAMGELVRIGNKEITVTKKVDTYSDTIEDGDFALVNGNKYIAIDVQNSLSKAGIISRARCSMDYANISRRVSIKNPTRSTEIDGGKNAVVRQELYNEYIELSYSSLANDSFVTADGKYRLMELFDNGTPLTDIPVELAVFSTDGADVKIISCKSIGTSNVMKFDFGFDSVNIAGNATKKTDGVWINDFVEYTEDENARFENFKFWLAGSFVPTIADTFAEHIKIAQALPNKYANAITEHNYIASDFINIEKDGGEIFKFTYQLTFVDSTPNHDIIVGSRLATENPLVVANTETLYYYKKSTPFDIKGDFINNYDSKLLIISGGTPAIDEIIVTWDSDKITVARTTDHYWAIGNDAGDLYFAINNEQANTIYFNPRNKRSD